VIGWTVKTCGTRSGLDRKQSESSNVARYFDSFKPIQLTNEEIANLPPAQADNEKAIPRKIRVSEEVLQSRATKKVQPGYPVEAKKAGMSGAVRVTSISF
jgi:hypothetical protein